MNMSPFRKSIFLLFVHSLILQESIGTTNACCWRRTAEKSKAEIDQSKLKDLENELKVEMETLDRNQRIYEASVAEMEKLTLSNQNLFSDFKPNFTGSSGQFGQKSISDTVNNFASDLNKWGRDMKIDFELYSRMLSNSFFRRLDRLQNFTETKTNKYYEYQSKRKP